MLSTSALTRAMTTAIAVAAAAIWLPSYAESAKRSEIQWDVLTKATAKAKNGAIEVIYPAQLVQQNGKQVTITGFMVPLEAKALQSRYLLTQKPQDCEFCIEGGPTSYIDVHGTPLKFSMQPMTLVGRLELLQKDPSGMYYRLTEAKLDKK
ncbi:MAG: hypothetical protein EOP24_29515 [Hyphomicrobiales bacterium]|nr:MAG: hypothetical protein EOP24_29515 [Hyphomicrobiales bacterium]